jgi:hypothetical protein
MFSNKSFSEGLEFDIYGRKSKNEKSGKKSAENSKNKKELERYYTLDNENDNNLEEDEEIDEDDIDDEEAALDRELALAAEEENENQDLNEDIEMEDGEEKIEKKLPSKQKKSDSLHKNNIKNENENSAEEENYTSDTSEEFENFLESRNNQTTEDPFDEIDEKNIPTGDETKRLSVMNIDWENIHAQDLFVLFNSFCKGKSKIEKVEIYPSEFGLTEMARENRDGPSADIFEETEVAKKHSKNLKNKKFSKNGGEGSQKIVHNLEDIVEEEENQIEGVNPLKLRQYELKKLKYYYAIVYCNTKEAAAALYQDCDGMEIEKTQSFMDLRFVPDSLEKFPYEPKETCQKLPGEYNPKFFSNSALQHSHVKMSWEREDPRRGELISKAFSKEQFNQEDIQQLLMSSDSETDEDARNFRDEFMGKGKGSDSDDEEELNLLKRKKNKDLNIKEGETIEISFNKGFEGVNENISINKTGAKDKSMWENYLEKKKNRRREKKTEERHVREEKKTKRNENNFANKQELNLLVDKSLKDKSFKYNKGDDRFIAINKDTRYAVDPTSKEYKNINKKNK